MNDKSEVIHGAGMIYSALSRESGKEFLNSIENYFPGFTEKLMLKFNAWMPLILGDTFIASFSEHLVPNETEFGRLSMWRTYGHPNGVALILNPDAIFKNYGNIGVTISPVEYFDESGVDVAFIDAASKIRANPKPFLSYGEEVILETAFRSLRYAAVCLKHRVFKEELEWRLIASTSMYAGSLIKKEIEFIDGVPQLVLKLPINDGTSPLSFNELLSQVLVGPCAHPEVVVRALAETLSEAGFEKPYSIIKQTKIPLR